MDKHIPVMLSEVLHYLAVEPGKKYIDATLGGGGHTKEILKLGGIVLGLDYDETSAIKTFEKLKSEGLADNLTVAKANFREIDSVAKSHGFESVDGILFDLGYSSNQLEDDEIGISYRQDVPLDMRIDKTMGVTAGDLINTLEERHLAELFFKFGEEILSRRFAKAIVDARSLKKIQTTKELSDILVDVAPSGYMRSGNHPARKVFQALRIVVNDELENLKNALPRAAQLLKLPGGRMVVISFHSLEDRVVKKFGNVRPTLFQLSKKPLVPTEAEAKSNKRSRSAKMRVFESKLPDENI